MTTLWVSLLIGLTGSLHCIGMCGPLISITRLFNDGKKQVYNTFVLYHLGRILTYAFLGAFLGMMGHFTEIIGVLKYLSLFFGLIIAAYSIFYLMGKKLNLNFLNTQSSTKIYNIVLKSKLPFKPFILGVLNGTVPCGLVYSAMVFSFMNNEILSGSISMVLFGLGTIPALFMSVYGVNFLKFLRFNQFRNIQYVGLLISSVWLIYRALLLDIDPNTTLWNSLINQTMCAH